MTYSYIIQFEGRNGFTAAYEEGKADYNVSPADNFDLVRTLIIRDNRELLRGYADTGYTITGFEIEEERAANAVRRFWYDEFGDDGHGVDMLSGELPLLYTTLTDEEIEIQMTVNLVDMEIRVYLAGNDEPETVYPITIDELETLDFNDYIAGWEFEIERKRSAE